MDDSPTSLQIQDSLADMAKEGLPITKGHRTSALDAENGINKKILDRWLRQWYIQAVQNYPRIQRQEGLSFLTMAAKGLPIFVVGIGPSLDGQIEALKKASGRALIICSDAALAPLQSAGIAPDLVISFDCRAEQCTLFAGLDTENLVLLANSCTHPLTLGCWKGKYLFFNMDHPKIELTNVFLPAIYPQFGALPNLGTVGNAAVLVAWIMGSTNIMLVGMDLCYKDDGAGLRYRCKDYRKSASGIWSVHDNIVLYSNSDRIKDVYITEINGVKYHTDPELDMYAGALVNAIGRWDLPVTNCSPGGVMEQYVKSMTVDQAIRELCTKPIGQGETIVNHLHKLLPEKV